ncbi:thioredoxin-like protein [Podospora fimiseda]|uniref:Thioredoxin-like protein n=1 Tax=Podospora fimiseda TaxID=252190 RepID=A0AAN7BZ53_9PEZI|nr:thioredoxin-like protein [Podospora fimiseda]
MFGFRSTKDIITLFHKAGSPTSTKVVNLLKQASIAAAESSSKREFELDITERDPTADQVSTILGYVGDKGASSVIENAATASDALKKFKENVSYFQKPLVVDWHNGKVVAGENESEILKLIEALPKN